MEDEAELRAKLTSPKASVRYEAAEMLRVQEWISPAGLSALQAALHDPDASVRESAASALKVHEQDAERIEEYIVEGEEAPRVPPDLPTPVGLTMVNEIYELRFSYRLPARIWLRGWAGVAFTLIVGWYLFYPQNMFYFALIACFALYLIYPSLAMTVNRATFQVTLSEIHFHYTPIPLIPSRLVPVYELLRLDVIEKYASSRFGIQKIYHMQAELRDGRKVSLFTPPPLYASPFPFDVLNFINVNTKSWLQFKDKQVVRVLQKNQGENDPRTRSDY